MEVVSRNAMYQKLFFFYILRYIYKEQDEWERVDTKVKRKKERKRKKIVQKKIWKNKGVEKAKSLKKLSLF